MSAPILLRLAALAPMHAQALAAGTDWLTPDETTRLAGMGSAHRRQQFLAGHWLVRVLAAQARGNESSAWQWARPEGEPAFLQCGRQRVFASISHSGDWLACAVAGAPIGLDVEASRKPRDFHALAAQVFSPDECALLLAGRGDLSEPFHRLWTIKEAFGKRSGNGLRIQDARRQQPVAVEPGEDGEVETWQGGGMTLALAHAGQAPVESMGLPADARHARWRIRTLA